MKKILAILFAVLMIVPFSIFASAAETVTLPAEPKVADDAPLYYVGFEGKGDRSGTDAANYAPTRPDAAIDGIADLLCWNKAKNGAKLVIEQKAYLGDDYTIEATKPILVTSLDPADNIMNMVLDSFGEPVSLSGDGQIGMVMIDCTKYVPVTITLACDIIFENTAFLDRSTASNVTYSVAGNGKLVVDDTVLFRKNTAAENAGTKIFLEVQEGGYAFLHSLGFDAYTGKGTIVIGDEAIKGLDLSIFSEFEGKVVNAKGEVLDIPEPPVVEPPVVEPPVTDPVDSTPATQKPDTPATQKPTTQKADATSTPATTQVTEDNAEDGNLIMIIAIAGAAVVVVAVVIVIIVKKKKD